MASLYATCKRDRTYTLEKVIPGLICAALFDSDESWYRARVISQIGQSSYSVLFVDYGNIESVNLVDMRKLDGSLFQYPALAVPVQIEELVAQAEHWGQLEQQFFVDHVIEEEFTVKFNVSKTNRASVTLIDANGDDIVDVIKRALGSSPVKNKDQMKLATPPKPGFDAREVINARSGRAGGDGKLDAAMPLSPQSPGGNFDRNRLGKPAPQSHRDARAQEPNKMPNFPPSGERRQNGAVGFDQKPDRNTSGNQRGDRDSQGHEASGDHGSRRNDAFGQSDRPNRSGFGNRDNRGSGNRDDRGNREDRRAFGQHDDRGSGNRDDMGSREDRRGFGNHDNRGFGNRSDNGNREDRRDFGNHDNRGFGNREDRRDFGNHDNRGFGNREDRRGTGSRDDGGFGDRENKGFGSREDRRPGSQPQKNFGERNESSFGQKNFGGGQRSFGGQNEGGFGGDQRSAFGSHNEGGFGGGRRDGNGTFGKRDEGSFQRKDNIGTQNDSDKGFGGKNSRGPRKSNDSDSFPQPQGKPRRDRGNSNSSSEQSVFSASSSKFPQPTSSQAGKVPTTGESFVLQDYNKFLPTEPVECRVCNFESPSSFFVVVVEEMNKLNELVKFYLSNPQNVKRPQKVEPNFSYLLPTGQTSGRRSEVIKMLENNEKCALICCDIGLNKPEVSVKQLLSLDAALASPCKLVIKSRLHGVIGPVTLADQEGEWTLSAFNKFKELTDKKDVKVVFKGRDFDNFVTVDILLDGDQSMSQLLLEKNFAVARQRDDELENANHFATFSADDENSVWSQGVISHDKDTVSTLLCCETSHIWVAHADRDRLLKNLQDELKNIFEKHGTDALLIKNPLLHSCYTATMAGHGIQRCRVEKIEETDSFVVRFIDFGLCQRVDKIHILPFFAAKVPYLAQRVPINPCLEKLISPFVMFELSGRDSLQIKLRRNECAEFADVVLNDKELSDEILELASKRFVDNRSFECDQVKLRVTEVSKVEEGNLFNASVVEAESATAENDAFQKELHTFYKNCDSETILSTLHEVNPLLPENSDLAVGSFVVFKNEVSDDKENSAHYCRGEIVEIDTDDRYAVRSIDYAATQTVLKPNIRKIVSRFCDRPAVSVQCSMVSKTSEELEELVGEEIEVALLHLGRINIVSSVNAPETEEKQDSDFVYPSIHSIDTEGQPLSISQFVTPVEVAYSLSRFDSEISNLEEEISMIWEDQENVSEEDLVKDELIACEIDGHFYRASFDSQKSELRLVDLNKTFQKTFDELSARNLPKYLQAIPVLGRTIQISGLIPVEDAAFVELETEIAKCDVGTHFCSLEPSTSDFKFGMSLYSKYLVDAGLARTAEMEEITPAKFKTDFFAIDENDTAHVVSAVDRRNIWVQVASTEEAIEELQKKLAEKFNEEHVNKPHAKLRRPKVGKACATKFAEDDCWYRAEVIEPTGALENGFVSVRFVDFGNVQKTEVSALYSLPEDLSESPKYALNLVVPTMEDLMNFDLEKHLNENVVGQKVKLSNIKLGDASVEAEVEFGDQDFIELLKYVRSNPKVSQQDMTPLRSINATVTFVSEDGSLYVQNNEAAHLLDEMMEKLKVLYSNLQDEELQLEDIEVGEYLVVKSPEDEELYRAQLLEKKQSEDAHVFEVLLIDYGNSLECPVDSCWKLSRDLATQPAQAYHCSIFDCDFDDEKQEQVCEFLSQMMECESSLNCEFQVRIDPLMVDINFQENWVTETIAEKEFLKEAPTICDLKYLDAECVSSEPTKCLLVSAVDPARIVLQLGGEVNDRLTLLQEDLNHYYTNQEVESLDPSELKEGCVVVAFDEEYQSFCRAVVEKIDSETESCQLRFVDWERTFSAATKDLKPLRHSFLNALRPQGILVALNEALPDEDEEYLISDQAVIEEIIGENELIVTEVGQTENGVPLVEIKLSSDESDLKQLLIGAGICRDSESAPLEWPKMPKSFYSMEVGSSAEVNIASVDKDGVYAQFDNHLEELETLLAKFETDKTVLRRPKVGKLCVSKFSEDGLYYRAEILKIEGGCADVLFVDYRNQEKCKLDELFEIGKDLATIPGSCLRLLFKPEISELINFDVLRSLSGSMVMTAECPKKCEIEVLTLSEDSVVVEMKFDGKTLLEEIDRIRAHLVVRMATLKNSEEPGFLLSNFENVASLYLIKHEHVAKREEFNKKMTSFYNHLSNNEELKVEKREFTPGAHVAVKIIPDANPLESSWSRAAVESVSEDGGFKLRLLDTGACIHKNKMELCRKLTKEFAESQETFVVKCKLYQVQDKPDSDVSQKVIELIKAVDHVPFSVMVISRTSVPQAIDVYVDEEKTLTEVLIGEDLVDAGASCEEYKLHEKLQIGGSLEVSYTDSSSPEDIRFQIVSASDCLSLLEEDIRSSVEFASKIEDVTAHKVCIAKSGEDDLWYRALVTEISTESQEDSNSIKVTFVDWGNNEWVSNENVKEIASEFCELPAQSISFSVVGLVPIEGSEWVEDDNEVLAEILSEAGKLDVVVKEFNGTSVNGDCSVNGTSLKSLLIESKVARDPNSSQETEFERLCWSNFGLEVGSQVPVWVSAVEPANFTWTIETGSDGKVKVGNWRDASHLKCSKFDKNFVWIQLDSNDDDLNQMNEYISKNSSSYKRLRRVRPGRMGVMKSEILDSWIRVQVLAIEEKNDEKTALVRAVDYGHTEHLASLDDLKELPNKIWKKHCFCLSVALEDLEIESVNIDSLEQLRNDLVFNEDEAVSLNVTSISDPNFPIVFGTLTFRNLSLRAIVDSFDVIPEIPPREIPCAESGSTPTFCFISEFDDPQNIHLQLASDYQTLISLQKEVNEFYNALKEGRMLACDVAEKQFVAFSDADQWKRGLVEKVVDSSVLEIRDVDTGKMHELDDKSLLRKLKPCFSEKPMFSFCTTLFALNPTGDNGWNKLECQSIVHANIPASGDVLVEILSDGKSAIMKLDGKDLAQQLIEKELAAAYEVTSAKIAPNAAVKENITLSCVLVDLETPNRALFQVSETNEDLISLEQDLYSFYENGSAKTMAFISDENLVGKACVIKSLEDEVWHRGVVKSCDPGNEEGSEEQCEVFLVDWGTSETLPRSCVYPTLDVFVSRLPPQAVIATLVSIVPDEADEDWLCPEDVEAMRSLMGEQETYNVKIGLVDEEKQVAFADIILDDEQSVCNKAVEAGFARFTESEGKVVPKFKTLEKPFADSEWVECKLWSMDADQMIVSPVDQDGEAEALHEKINELVLNKELALNKLRRVKVGRSCIVIHSDEMYYRAEICKVDEENPDQVEVFLSDFGEFSTVTKSKCFEVNVNETVVMEAEKCTVAVKQVLAAGEFTEAVETEIWDCLNVETNKFFVRIPETGGNEPVTAEIKINEDFLSEFVQAISSPNVTLPVKLLPAPGSKIMAAVSCMATDCFYIHLEEDADPIAKMQAELNEKYSNSVEVAKFSLDQDLLQISATIACKCSEDGNWYRAEIMQLEDNTKKYKVKMIDYGFTDQAILANLCRLDRKFHSQPPLSLKCVLNGISLKVSDDQF